MPAYAYRAVHASGRLAKGSLEAANENELAHYLRESGMELIEARVKRARALRLPSIGGRSVSPRVIAGFCTRMHDMLASGIAFPEALRDAARGTDNKVLRHALEQIMRALDNGGGIAMSFELYPRLFPPVFIAILAAGERSGEMPAIFDYLARYAEARARTQENLRRALQYPVFLLFVAGGAVGFMLAMVVPQVVQFLNGLQGKLPLATQVLVAASALFTRYGALALTVGFLAFAIITTARLIFADIAIALDAMLLRLPAIGKIVAKTSLARFAHSFAILFRSGCDVPACLQQARGTIGNRALRMRLELAELRVQSGASLSAALDGVMPDFALGLLRTGERSGKLGKSLDDIALAYDREAKAATDSFIGLLEPCLTLAIGGILAWTVIAVLGPLYGSLSILGGRM